MTLVEKIRSRGYWDVTIRPATFVENRIAELAELAPIVERSQVSLRGWNFPHVRRRETIARGLNWTGQESEWNHYKEAWRLYKSGLFRDLSSLKEDWQDESTLWPAIPD